MRQSLPTQRTYRAICEQADTGEQIECVYHDTYMAAHKTTLDWDELYDFPAQNYWVERSIDGGLTWHRYDAEEFINGAPAWTYPGL